MEDSEKHMYCTNKFIKLANEMRNEDVDITMVSGSLITASCIYATYAAGGNNTVLEESGIDKVVKIFRRTLEHHQVVTKSQIKEQPK